jgi:folate-binding protein YgfZ
MLWRSSRDTAVWVRGRDRVAWLNGLVTCDVAKLRPASAAYGLLLEKKGRIATELYVAHAGEALLLVLPRASAEAALATLDHHLIMEDVELAPLEDTPVFFAHDEGVSPEGALFSGAVALVPGERDMLVVGGHAEGKALVDDEAWEALRVRRGLPRFGVDFTTAHYPQEASLERVAVAFDKGCYLGQEVVYMLENRGHARQRLMAIDLVGGPSEGQAQAVVPPLGTPVCAVSGDAIGEITSATPHGSGAVAIARVKSSAAPAGTSVVAAGANGVVRELGVRDSKAALGA